MPKKTIHFYSPSISLKRILLFISIIMLGISTTISLFWYETQSSKNSPTVSANFVKEKLMFGLVDPDRTLINQTEATFDHQFIPWGIKHLENTKIKLRELNPTRNLIVTIEPFKTTNPEDLFLKTLSGGYDIDITSMKWILKIPAIHGLVKLPKTI